MHKISDAIQFIREENMSILSTENAVLLVIDIQEKLLNAQFEKEKITKNIGILAETAKIMGVSAIASEQYPKGLGATLDEIKAKLPEDAAFVEKTCFNCCDAEGFNETLKNTGKKQVIVTGMEAHVCVHQTVDSLLAQGYEVHVVCDAVTSRKEWEYNLGLKRMEQAGAIVTCVETVVFEFLRDSKNPHFKAVQALIK